MYNDDFYAEPTEFEVMIDEFKESLIKSVKKEYLDEMERLRKENEELQEFKQNKEKIEREHNNALRDMKYKQEEYLRNAKKMRLTELLGENMLMGWYPSYEYEYPPKCDKCKTNRYVQFTSPGGRLFEEPCPTCSEGKKVFHSEQIECYSFTQRKSSWDNDCLNVSLYFERKETEDYDEIFESNKRVYQGEPYTEVNEYYVVFFKEEDCQKYCEWLNNKT